MTKSLDLGASRADGGYFLLRPVRPQAFAPPVLRSRESDCRFCFTYQQSHPSIEEELLQMVRGAKRKIFITSFRIGHQALFDELFAAAQRLRGGVYVITALDERNLSQGLKELDELAGRGADTPTMGSLKASFEEMTRRGIYVRGHSACHAKFVVVDDEIALVSSANLETAALRDAARRGSTGECGVTVRTPREVNRLARLFTHLWYEGCDWEIPAGVSYTVQKRKSTPAPCAVHPPNSSQAPAVIWTDGKEWHILETMRSLIQQARRELLLSSFSLSGMIEHADLLLDPLAAAIRERGVRVRLLIRGRNNVAGHCADAHRLAELGVEIAADGLNHAKAVIADGQFGALFSANFDAQHGLTNGVEVGIRLDGLPALQDAREYFEHAIANADLDFFPKPDGRALNESLAARWRRHWPWAPRLSIHCAEEDWRALAADASAQITLFQQSAKDSLEIQSGTKKWYLQAPDALGTSVLKPAGAATITSSQLLRDWLSVAGGRRDSGAFANAETRRGICPAVFTWLPPN